MKITPLQPLAPMLTDEQVQAAAEIMKAALPHRGVEFLVEGFPGAPDLGRLIEALEYFIDTKRHAVYAAFASDGLRVRIGHKEE